jgi:hypothetical protein
MNVTIGIGWRPDDKANPFPSGEWLMVTTRDLARPEWFLARFIEGEGWLDEKGVQVRDVRWWRPCEIHEEPPAA